jgi:hypothetical protein
VIWGPRQQVAGFEIKRRKVAVVLLSGGIVGPGGVDFAREGAEIYSSAVELNPRLPLSLNPVPFEAFVFGGGL